MSIDYLPMRISVRILDHIGISEFNKKAEESLFLPYTWDDQIKRNATGFIAPLRHDRRISVSWYLYSVYMLTMDRRYP